MNPSKIILLVIALHAHVCSAQNAFEKTNSDVRSYIEQYIKKEKVPGICMTISYNDTVIFSEGFGYADFENKIKTSPAQTKFRIASITKTLTAGIVAKLWEGGLIDILKSPYFYLDSLPKKQFDFTIEQVGGHLAGLKRIPGEEKYSCDNAYGRKDFYRVFKDDELLFKPSQYKSYSNYGFKLLGLVIEKITGNSITENHKKYIIGPLGLKNTLPDSGLEHPLISKFYIRQKNKFLAAPCLDCTFKYAQGCYLSTSEDLVKIGNAYLFIGRIFKKESLLKLITSQKLSDGKRTDYGFGFITTKDFGGNAYYGHNGGYEGSSSILRVYPKHKLVVSILLNMQKESADDLASKIAGRYIDKIK